VSFKDKDFAFDRFIFLEVKMKSKILGLMVIFSMVLSVLACATTNNGDKKEKLMNELESEMQSRAIEMAKARHRNSDLETISVTDRETSNSEEFIYVSIKYKVLMRGNILGIIGNNVDVIVRGQINMRNKTIKVLDTKIL
jgi:hypothetical protein